MSTNESDANESIDTRTRRALTEAMTVMDGVGRARDAPGLYLVVGENAGGEYLVDTHTGACECPDAEHRNPDGGCKHQRRVAFATGERPVPGEVDGVDEQLGAHTDGVARVVAADGGIVEAGDDGVILDESDENDRPDDCSCLPTFDGLSCWPCAREGFEEPNPNAEADD